MEESVGYICALIINAFRGLNRLGIIMLSHICRWKASSWFARAPIVGMDWARYRFQVESPLIVAHGFFASRSDAQCCRE
jgi:hypothetical protein